MMSLSEKREVIHIGFDVVSLWWFGHDVIVDNMEDTCVDVIPELITLTPNCNSNNSDISTMSSIHGNEGDENEDNSASASDGESDDDEPTLRQQLDKLKKKDKKRKQQMINLQEKLKDNKQARQLTESAAKKKVTHIKNLAEANTLPLDKQISLNNYFRDVVFRNVKLVTKEVLEDGFVVGKIMQHLQFITDYDKNMYRLHIELALQAKISQYRDNSLKNIKWKYRTKKGTGPGM
jgi:hypothetical protein